MQKIHDKWLNIKGCVTNGVDSNTLSLTSFWGLFTICGIACVLALIVFSARVCCQYNKSLKSEEDDEEIQPTRSRRTSRTSSFKDLIVFADKKETEIKEILRQSKKRRHSSSLDLQSISTHLKSPSAL